MTTYVYRWKNNPTRVRFYGRRCVELARGTMNSRLVEFDDGERIVTSGNALRRERPALQGESATSDEAGLSE